MIQYLSFSRPDPGSKNGKKTKNLPFNLLSISDLQTNTYLAVEDKLRILMEQAVLGFFLLEMNEGKSQSVSDYILYLQRIARFCLPDQSNSMNKLLYSKYRETLISFLEDNKSAKYDAISMLEDRINFSKEACMIPSDFYLPYLRTACRRVGKGNNPDYAGAVMLMPHVETCKHVGGQRVVFSSVRFTSCSLSTDFQAFSVNPSLEYMLRLDWSGKSWIQFTDLLQSFCVGRKNIFESHQSTSGVIANILYRESRKNLISSKSKIQFISCLRYLHQTYRMDLDAFESMSWMLSGLGYENLDFLTSSHPTNRELLGFEQYSDLEFIKQYKLQAAMEADDSDPEDEEEKPEEQKDSEPDDMEDDPETDPESDDAGSEDPMMEPDEETPDEDMGDDPGSDDMGGDTSSGSDSGDGAKQTDTPSDPKDPFSISLEITKSESMDEYFQREELISMITSLILNPPETVSSETVAFLRVWVNQWINLVSVETTKSVLSQLAVTFDV